MRLKMTEDIARAVSMDAGNASMRKNGRTRWSRADLLAAGREYHRLAPCPVEADCSWCNTEQKTA